MVIWSGDHAPNHHLQGKPTIFVSLNSRSRMVFELRSASSQGFFQKNRRGGFGLLSRDYAPNHHLGADPRFSFL